MDEKDSQRTRRFNAVGCCLTGIRIWQWSSSFFVWGSFSLLYDHIQRNRLGENGRMKGVQHLGLVSLAYSTLILCCVHVFKTLGLRSWRAFAFLSLPGDLTIMGICLAKITILSFSGLPADCHGLTRDNYDGSDLMRQPAEGYNTIRFGSWSTAMSGELDRLCTFPRTVYGLSVVAIFSYTLSVVLSVLYIQQQQQQQQYRGPVPDDDSEKAIGQQQHQQPSSSSPRPTLRHIGVHAENASTHAPSILDLDDNLDDVDTNSLDAASARPPSPATSHRPLIRSSRAPSTRSRASSIYSHASSSAGGGWGASITLTNNSASDAGSVISGTSLPPRPLAGSVVAEAAAAVAAAAPRQRQRRWSTSTSSSYDANAFVVTDGFRAPGPGADAGLPSYHHSQGMTDPVAGASSDLPVYSSRPGSLYHEPMKYAAGLGMPGMPKP